MRTVTHSMEDYLKTILVIGKEKPVVRAVDISARMRVTKPSVHRAVQLLREEGYIEVSENNHIRLTEQGLMTAQAVNERHEFFVRLLSAAGVPQETAEDEACRICCKTNGIKRAVYCLRAARSPFCMTILPIRSFEEKVVDKRS